MTPTRAATISGRAPKRDREVALSRVRHYDAGGSPRHFIPSAILPRQRVGVTRACVSFYPLFISRGGASKIASRSPTANHGGVSRVRSQPMHPLLKIWLNSGSTPFHESTPTEGNR